MNTVAISECRPGGLVSPDRRQPARHLFRDFAVAVSVANLSFLRLWSENTYTSRDAFWMAAPPAPSLVGAAMFNVLALAVLFFLAMWVVRRFFRARLLQVARWGFLLLLVVPLNAARHVVSQRVPRLEFLRTEPLLEVFGSHGLQVVAVLASLGAAAVIWRYSAALIRVAYGVLLVLSPVVVFTFGHGIHTIAGYDAAGFADKPLADSIRSGGEHRVLWVVFDEFDERLAFHDRPPTVRLPNFGRLRRESLVASNAYPPGPNTAKSLPSYTLGRVVEQFREVAPDRMDLRVEGTEDVVSWSVLPNVFRRAAKMDLNTAVVGWRIPYCRVLAQDLSSCSWWASPQYHNSMGETVLETMGDLLRSILETNTYSPFGQTLIARHYARQVPEILEAARAVAVDPRFDFTLLHVPVPHGPHLYDLRTGRLSATGWSLKDYASSLVLADRFLGELRSALEDAALWDSSTVLVTSDHAYRSSRVIDGKSDARVPFLLKLPGQRAQVVYETPFNTVLAADLLLATIEDGLDTPQQAVAWLEGRRSDIIKPSLP